MSRSDSLALDGEGLNLKRIFQKNKKNKILNIFC